MSTTTDLSVLKINYLTQEQYEDALEDGLIQENELYMTPSVMPNVTASTTDITPGTTPLNTGDLYLVYEV